MISRPPRLVRIAKADFPRWFIAILIVFFLNAVVYASQSEFQQDAVAPTMVRIPGHVLEVLPQATQLAASEREQSQKLAITIVLNRDDENGFEQYLREVYDPQSKDYREYLTQSQIADSFGPSRSRYDALLSYLRDNGLRLLAGSTNRLTITVRGTRAQVQKAFTLRIDDYQLGGRKFYANNVDPSLPARLAPAVQAVTGLNDLAVPQHSDVRVFLNPAGGQAGFVLAIILLTLAFFPLADLAFIMLSIAGFAELGVLRRVQTDEYLKGFTPAAPGRGQTVAVTSFSKADVKQDVQDLNNLYQTLFFTLLSSSESSQRSGPGSKALAAGTPPSDLGVAPPDINNLSVVDVDGGATSNAGESELLVDIDQIMTTATGAKVVVYDAPFTGPGTSFQSLFNRILSDGTATIITNSWAYCEDQTTAADAQSIDTIFQNAAAAGISIFNASGDTGSTCLDGSPNTVAVPADSPHATAVGGSSFTAGDALTYGSETYWDGSKSSPPTGQGGFGVSRFFAAPSYQGSSVAGMRSVPDVVTNADPADGMLICQADNGGCPNGALWGGTSRAAPSWAAYTAVLNELNGKSLGFLNPQIYPLANTAAFHNAVSLNSDSAHVGLGSPSLGALSLQLAGQSAGPVNPTISIVDVYAAASSVPPSGSGISADGKTQAVVKVELTDDNGNNISGKTVALAASSGSAQITPIRTITDSTNGTALFAVTDTVPESVTFTATNTTDNVQLISTSTAVFVTPAAANAGLNAFPTTVTADGTTPTDITITLTDSLGRPTPGKQVQLTQTGGNSVISGPVPPVTDSNGMIKFTAVDSNNETITYSAVDVTDGNLPFPETGTVTFSNAPIPGCSNTQIAAPGYVAVPYAIGFTAQNFFFSGINFSGCPGVGGIAFDSSGNLFVTDLPTGNLYKIPPGGGSAGAATLVGAIGTATGELAFDQSGNLYAGRFATGGSFNTGAVIQIDPVTGAVIRTVASNLTCSGALAGDPLSGDLFTDDGCSGGGGDNPALWRISGLGGSSPATTVYTNLPSTPNADIAFAPSGTIYVYNNGQVAKVTGTNAMQPPAVSVLSNLTLGNSGLQAYGAQANGDAQFLIANFPANTSVTPNVPATAGIADLTGATPSISTPLIGNGGGSVMITGPDGCLYVGFGVSVWKITDAKGTCNYSKGNPAPSISLNPSTFSSSASQGSPASLTATVHNATVPAGTPITFSVSGANSQQGLINTDSGANASFSYTGAMQGTDNLIASATINGATVTSNPAIVTWGPGTDVTFMTLNQSDSSGTVNQSVTLAANLVDVSVNPNAPVAGQQVNFSLEGTNCSATTDSQGNASCKVTPSAIGMLALTGSFPGTGQYNPSSASRQLLVLAATPSPSSSPTPTATASVAPTPTPSLTPTPTTTPTPGPGVVSATPVKVSGKAGETVDAGTFTVNNTSSDSETIESVTVSFSDPGLFSSASLSATVGGTTQQSQAATPPSASTTFTFSPALVLPPGGTASFSLSATVASKTAARERRLMIAYAGDGARGPRGGGDLRGLISLCLIGLGLCVVDRRRLRRTALIAVMMLALGTGLSACGGGSGGASTTPSSSQNVTQITGPSGAIDYSGLPASLGKVTKQ
jgi:hypothetical protein